MKILTSVFVTLLSFSLSIQLVSAQKWVKGNGKVEKENRNVSGFTGVKVGGAFDVFIEEGNSYEVVVEADENLMEIIDTHKEGKTLVIKTNKSLRDAKELNVYVRLKELDHLDVSGAANVIGRSDFSSKQMTIDASGAADVDLKLRAEAMVCNQSGSSDVEISGSADQVGISLSGSSDFKGSDFKAEHGKINSSGSSSAHIYLSKSIEANASGSSDIHCNGNPSKTQIHTSGSADIHLR